MKKDDKLYIMAWKTQIPLRSSAEKLIRASVSGAMPGRRLSDFRRWTGWKHLLI